MSDRVQGSATEDVWFDVTFCGTTVESSRISFTRAREWIREVRVFTANAASCALRFAAARGFPILVRAYLGEAIAGYRAWGAAAKVTALAREFGEQVAELTPMIDRSPVNRDDDAVDVGAGARPRDGAQGRAGDLR